jgi:hypothetical protein
MQRFVTVYQADDAVDEFLTFKIADLPKNGLTSQMIRTVGIAPRACKRTLLRDFNGQKWGAANQDGFPSA